MRSLAPDWDIESAGTAGWHVGDPPYPPMQKAAIKRGYNLGNLRAQQFLPADFGRFDLIVAMDRQNLADIEHLRPIGAQTPAIMMADMDVPDPYYTRDFDGALDLIETAARRLLADRSR